MILLSVIVQFTYPQILPRKSFSCIRERAMNDFDKVYLALRFLIATTGLEQIKIRNIMLMKNPKLVGVCVFTLQASNMTKVSLASLLSPPSGPGSMQVIS